MAVRRGSPARALLLAAACALMVCAALAARVTPSDRLIKADGPNNLETLQWLDEHVSRVGPGRDRDAPVYLAINYKVPPSLRDKFVKEWRRLDKALQKAEGLTFYQATETANDNTDFWSYTEWESFEDLQDNFDTDEFEDFRHFLNDNDILVEAFRLDPAGDLKREYRFDREGERYAAAARAAAAKDLERRRRGRGEEEEEEDPRDIPAHVAITFHVPPSIRRDFEEAFEDVQRRVVEQEDENRFYVLRKFSKMNHHYVLRAGWDSLDSWLDHLTSEPFRRLRKFTKGGDIEWRAHPFRVLVSSEEEDEV